MPPTPTLLGHNQGPPLASGGGWAHYCWKQAHARQKAKVLPLIATRRARRAQDLGLPYAVFNAAVLDSGRWPEGLVFGLGGTLVRGMNGRVWFDRLGRFEALRDNLARLERLKDCRLFLVGGHPLGPGEESLRPRVEACAEAVAAELGARLREAVVAKVGGQVGERPAARLLDWATDFEEPAPWPGPRPAAEAADAPPRGALDALLRRHGLVPAQLVMVGDGSTERRRAEAVRLPAFVPAEVYFTG